MTQKAFSVDTHKRVLTELLVDIIKYLGPKVAFKGGTAAMMFYNLPRMSLDLDFDLFQELTEEEIDNLKIIIKKGSYRILP